MWNFIVLTSIPIPIPAKSPVENLNQLLLFRWHKNCVVPSKNVGVTKTIPNRINSML